MSILRNLVAPERREASLSEALLQLRRSRFGGSYTPLTISPESSLRHAAVWSSTNLISDLIATLPLDEFRRTQTRPVLETDPSPIITDPNRLLSADSVWRQNLMSVLFRGNSWGLILERDDLMFPTRTEILHPDEVAVRRRGKLGDLEVRWNGVVLDRSDYWRMVGYTFPGSPVGLSPINYVAETIGLGKNAQQFGADWFEQGGHPSAVLSNENLTTFDRIKAQVVKDQFKDSVDGGDVAVLAGGWKYSAIQINPEESQFLDTIRANRGTVATIFGLRPEDIGESSGDSLTYANVEQRQIARLVYPISQWIIRLENAISGLLRPDRFAKFNVDAMLRVDLLRRYQAHGIAIRTGWKNRNEVRDHEDLGPIPAAEDGDEYLWPPYRAFKIESDEEGDPNAA